VDEDISVFIARAEQVPRMCELRAPLAGMRQSCPENQAGPEVAGAADTGHQVKQRLESGSRVHAGEVLLVRGEVASVSPLQGGDQAVDTSERRLRHDILPGNGGPLNGGYIWVVIIRYVGNLDKISTISRSTISVQCATYTVV
jgi:hypothetical protein